MILPDSSVVIKENPGLEIGVPIHILDHVFLHLKHALGGKKKHCTQSYSFLRFCEHVISHTTVHVRISHDLNLIGVEFETGLLSGFNHMLENHLLKQRCVLHFKY